MSNKKKLYTIYAIARIPLGTVEANSDEEASMLSETFETINFELCSECRQMYGDIEFDGDIEVEEIESPDHMVAPMIPMDDATNNMVEVKEVKQIPLALPEIKVTEVTTYAGSKRGFKVNEVTPQDSTNAVPEHIQPYLMTEEEKKEEAVKPIDNAYDSDEYAMYGE